MRHNQRPTANAREDATKRQTATSAPTEVMMRLPALDLELHPMDWTDSADAAGAAGRFGNWRGLFRPSAWKLVGVDALMQLHHNIHTLRGEKIAGY